MTKVLGIIQARMASTRLPNKVMLPILQKPIIWHIYNRLKSCDKIDEICIATSTNSLDDEIEKFAIEHNINIFRGSEEMVPDRLLGAANKFTANTIVRVTGDCPLIEPEIIDNLVEIYLERAPNIDFVCNTIKRTFPDGLDTEVISVRFIERLLNKLTDPISRHWFILHMLKNHKQYRCINLENSQILSHLRWTVDYEEDYSFVKAIYKELYVKKRIFHLEDILLLIGNKPHLMKLNKKHAVQNPSAD